MNLGVTLGGGWPSGGRLPAIADLQRGSRQDVARVLEAFGPLARDDAILVLAHAWYADVLLSRSPNGQKTRTTQREVQSLIQGLTIHGAGSQNARIDVRTLSELYLAGEESVAQGVAVMLRHPRQTVRASAARLCEAFYDPRSLEHLSRFDSSDPAEAVRASLQTICRLGDERYLPQIEEALVHPDEGVCLCAIQAIKRLRPPLAAVLLDDAAQKRRPVVCVTALQTLGELGDLQTMPRLIERLASDFSFRRIGAARGLAALALARPDGNFGPAMEALQKRERQGGVEYRYALEAIRRVVGIDPELPIPSVGVASSADSLPIPGEAGKSAAFERQLQALPPDEVEEDQDDSLARRLRNTLPPPEEWEYD